MRTLLLAFALVGCGTSGTTGPGAGDPGGGKADGDGDGSGGTFTVPSLYSSWYLPPSDGGYYNIDARVRVDVDPGPSVSIFWSTQFWFVGNVAAGYMGIQDGAGSSGKLAIASIWNATAASPGPGATCGPFDESGTGFHCTLDYPWVAGHTYRSRLWVVDASAGLWQSSILDEVTGVESVVGNLTIPSSAMLDVPVDNFTEDFDENGGLTYASCSAVPMVSAVFFAPTGNNLEVTASDGSTSIAMATCNNVESLLAADASYAIHQINTSPDVSQPTCGAAADGTYCGQDAILGGANDVLYECSAGAIAYIETCSTACLAGGGGSDVCD